MCPVGDVRAWPLLPLDTSDQSNSELVRKLKKENKSFQKTDDQNDPFNKHWCV